jgi:hypothetical protein
MSEADLATVILMVFGIMLVMSFWRQIIVLMLSAVIIVSLFGVYYIVCIIARVI